MGCQLMAVPCRPCTQTLPIYNTDCPIQDVSCVRFPWQMNPNFSDFSGVLNLIYSNFLTTSGFLPELIQPNTLESNWKLTIYLENVPIITVPFFKGRGVNLGMGISYPYGSANGILSEDYDNALFSALDYLSDNYGYEYYFERNADDTLGNSFTVFNSVCGTNDAELDFKYTIEIDFTIIKTINQFGN